MTAIKSFFGLSIAFLLIPLVLVAFVGMNPWAKLLVSSTGLKISPWYSGGEIARSVDHGSYKTRIYKPVFDGLLSQRSEGFVQIDWSNKKSVPTQIDEQIDFDGDGKNDFRVQWDTRSDALTLTPSNTAIIGMRGHYTLDHRYAIRVDLKNPPASP